MCARDCLFITSSAQRPELARYIWLFPLTAKRLQRLHRATVTIHVTAPGEGLSERALAGCRARSRWPWCSLLGHGPARQPPARRRRLHRSGCDLPAPDRPTRAADLPPTLLTAHADFLLDASQQGTAKRAGTRDGAGRLCVNLPRLPGRSGLTRNGGLFRRGGRFEGRRAPERDAIPIRVTPSRESDARQEQQSCARPDWRWHDTET